MKKAILIVDDEIGFREMLQWHFQERGYEAVTAADVPAALELLKMRPVSLVVSDYTMPRIDGMSLLKSIKERWPQVPVILMTGFGTVETAVNAMRHGAFDFILKPFELEHLLKRIEDALASSL